MPSRYICSNCGAPVSPAQNRCHKCGAEIDWRKAVGRVSYITYLPDARKRRRRRRVILATALLTLLAIILLGWNTDWAQNRWQNLRRDHLSAARDDLQRTITLQEKQTPASPPTPAPDPTPTSLAPASPTKTPTAAPLPAPSPIPAPTLTPTPDESQALELVLAAQKLSPKDPCRAAELLQSALELQDLGWIETMRQENQARCQQTAHTTAAPITSPLPTPPPAPQRIAYTTYDPATRAYAIQTGNPHQRQPGPKLIENAIQPAFGPGGLIAYRAVSADQPGIHLLQPDGETQRITKGPDDSWPRWGPGGQQIIFTSAQRSPDSSPHIYLVDIATRLVEDLGPGRNADWSRNGHIIFSGCDVSGEQCGLWLLNPTSLQRSQLTHIPDDDAPIWSPDGRYLAFMSSGRSESWDIFILDTQTDFIIPTAPHPAEDGLPAWSPDGRAIAFLSDRDDDWALFTWWLDDLTTHRLFTVSPQLPNWQQAGIDWQKDASANPE